MPPVLTAGPAKTTMPTTPPIRSDAARNRANLLDAATQAFSAGDEVSMRNIADAAGVGVGTLYRHFPTRAALVDAVYRDQADRLTRGADDLLERFPPAEATRRWMDLFADWLAAKRGMLGTLQAPDSHAVADPVSRTRMLSALDTLLKAGAAAGALRSDIQAEDVAAALVGTFLVAGRPDARAQAARLMDVLVDGLKPPAT